MDKKLILQIAVVVVVIFFLLQPLGMGGRLPDFLSFFNNENTATQLTGLTVFNATIRTYDPYLILASDTNQSIINELNTRADVKSVVTDAQGIIVETETRDDVYPLASYLRSKGVSSLSQANLALPQTIQVDVNGEQKEIFTSSGIIQVISEAVVDADTEVTVSMIAVISGNQLVQYQSPSILFQQTTILVNAQVVDLNYKLYTYTIPWESRNSLGNLSQYGEYTYNKKDSIIFNPPLDINQILIKKQFSYIDYIDAGSAQVASDFDNITQLESNFQDVSYSLPSSQLTIKTNETPNISFNATVSYNYNLLLETDYEFENPVITTDLNEEQNATVELNISIVALGKKVVSIGKISPS
ncbi:hypothetical protein KKB44_01090 [Candidatus Micrarchaeota archaeon]|nr:hypothetical protein [Candidatus Micrarchaeota archaeon]